MLIYAELSVPSIALNSMNESNESFSLLFVVTWVEDSVGIGTLGQDTSGRGRLLVSSWLTVRPGT